MPQIISLGFGPSSQNFDRVLRFAGKNIHVTHFAVDFDEELLLSLVKRYEKECDVLAISGLPPPIYTQKRALKHRLITQIEQLVQSCPLVTGHILRSTVMDWGLQHATENNLLQVKDKTLTVLCGLSQWELVQSLEAQAKDVYCLDPMLHYRLKLAVKGQKELETYARTSYPILYKRPIEAPGQLLSLQPNRFNPRLNAALEADLFIGTSSVVSRFDCRAFAGKTLLLDEMNEPLAEALRAAQVHNTFWLKPDLEGIGKNLPYAVLEALILLSRSSDEALNQDDVLEFLVNQKITPTLHSLHTERRHPVRRFAFVIHPLSQGDLFRHPLLSPLGYLPRRCNQWIEKGIALVPGVAYGKITGICSTADGGQAEGLIYTLFATPREMLAADPESIYQKLLAIAADAKSRGAEIMGLGAFTKIVGDAGVTVAQRSPIPITTGNSLSAAATLWAAREAYEKMGFISSKRGLKQKIQGRVMVIGATGSIGKVCVRILAAIFSDLVLVATNPARLMNLRDEIQAMSPDCNLKISTRPDRYAKTSDLIVIATSATEGGVLSIDAIKPGAVVCDVGRPLTFSAQEAITRPDVLIIESGEIELPGQVSLNCDIGLESSVVYACLAETALLALEGRMECFTLSRNINYKKVIEIYKMAKRHGARLASIRSPTGIVTDQEIELCREHALKALNRGVERGSPKDLLSATELHSGQ